MDYFDILYQTYDFKMKARQLHQENFIKWMTFYYVAIGGMAIALYQLKDDEFLSFILIIFGILTSYFWHLSCKGYKHWNDHWIHEVWAFENEIERTIKSTNTINCSHESLEKLKVYKNQPQKKKVDLYPINTASISTPKITLAFSFTTYVTLLTIFVGKICYLLNKNCLLTPLTVIMVVLLVVVTHLILFLVLPKVLYSKTMK